MNTKLLRSLQIFVEVAHTSNMSMAAKNLHMTVSAISQQLRKLEMEAGLSLFNRNTRHISLTEAGQIYYQTSMKLLEVARNAQHAIEQLQESPSGKLKITAPEGFGGGLLSKPLNKLLSDYPKISVALELTDDSVDVIATGADLAISLEKVNEANLECSHLATWDLLLCVAGDHPLAKIEKNTPSDLQDHTFLSHRVMPNITLTKPNEANITLAKSRIEVNAMQALIRLTRDGLGYAVLPEPEVRDLLKSGELVNIFAEWNVPTYSVYAVTPKHEAMPVKTQATVNCLKESFSVL
ncbi:LysR family transcriptional regulator [Alteromonas sp. C1M14]|uniref:LysR family transcriptional regulator n=1 Tax=Alteromonas sp. C1M14 TaxID=2841567 RepID=UPI001C0A5379|nr:LysR family transcriptional regulator [Alteromonas sp. C1M14]MBU2978173.1 LysR family transcriptional regulator [Alteromonas sp. C1M14]